VVISMDAQTWAAPQTAHYLRGDKFEKPMGKIVQARAQVKLCGYPRKFTTGVDLEVQTNEKQLELGVCAGSNIETKNGLCFRPL